MTLAKPLKMDADTFLAWSMERPGRYELSDGEVVAMAPERVRHALAKGECFVALRQGIEVAGLACQVFPDGMAVRIDDATVYEPDVLVRCGPELEGDVIQITDPVIVVEVLSPSTQTIDSGAKLADYFRLPSVRHYIIVRMDSRCVIHHALARDGTLKTAILSSGPLILDPPGIVLDVASLFSDAGR